MIEAEIERRVVKYCNDHKLLTYKFTSPSHRGVPDRVIIGPGRVLFLELKQAGKKPTPLQEREIRRINQFAAGETVVARWAAGLDEALNAIRQVFGSPP
jgi:hypothetical protein